MASRSAMFRLVPLLTGVAAAHASATDTPFARAVTDASGQFGDSVAYSPSISSDGRFVAYSSLADNLVPGDTNGSFDIFVKDLVTGAIERVSVASDGSQANGSSYLPSISDDGNLVAFSSDATNLVSGDTNGRRDVFVHDRTAGTTVRVSVDSSGGQLSADSDVPSISGDGNYVAFQTQGAIVGKDTNSDWDVYLAGVVDHSIRLVSVSGDGASAGDNTSWGASVDADGSHVAFTSKASNLVLQDRNGVADVFVRDMTNRITVRCSVDSNGNESRYGGAGAILSRDARVVAFSSFGDDLVPGDTNDEVDAFVHQLDNGLTERVSVGSNGEQPNSDSYPTGISGDGTRVTFASDGNNFAGGGNYRDVFLRDRPSGLTSCISANSAGVGGNGQNDTAVLSVDGRFTAFFTESWNLVGDDLGENDVLVRDLAWIPPTATWANYGAGFAGTHGVPRFAASAAPSWGASLALDLDNSVGFWTIGFLFVGLGEASTPTNLGGTLLVDFFDVQVLAIPSSGAALPVTVPLDARLCDVEADFQVVEVDPGARYGFSFTPGLALVFGD